LRRLRRKLGGKTCYGSELCEDRLQVGAQIMRERTYASNGLLLFHSRNKERTSSGRKRRLSEGEQVHHFGDLKPENFVRRETLKIAENGNVGRGELRSGRGKRNLERGTGEGTASAFFTSEGRSEIA